MKSSHAAMLLAAVIAARSTSLLFSKLLLVDMGPFMLLGLRFALAFIVLFALFGKRLLAADRATLAHGAVLGALLFATMAFEVSSLTMTASSTVAFLENTAIVIVPAASSLLARRLPSGRVVAASAMALAGVGFVVVSPQGGQGAMLLAGAGFGGLGEALVMGAALCYSAVIMAMARFSKRDDALVLGIVQVGVTGALGTAFALLFEAPALPATGEQWGALLELVAVCTVFGFTVQPLAQRHLSADIAGLFCAITPLVGGVLGVAFLGEPFGPFAFAGMALILGAMALAALPERKRANHGSEIPRMVFGGGIERSGRRGSRVG